MVRTAFKILSFAVVTVIVLLALVIIMIRAGALNGIIVNTAEKIAGKNLTGKLEIAELRGNIFSAFSLHGILLTLGQDTIMNCDRVEVSYSIMSLLSRQIELRKVFIGNLSLNLEQSRDSSWNFMQLLKTPETKDTLSGVSDWVINVMEFKIAGLSAGITKAIENRYIPEYISSEISLSAFMSGDSMKVILDDFNLMSAEPDFKMTRLSGSVTRTGTLIEWENVVLQLTTTMAGTSGKFATGENGMADIRLQFTPLAADELLVFLPGVELHGNPDIKVSLDGNAAHYNFDAHITERDQGIELSGWLKDYRSDPGYSAEMVVENLDGSSWTGNEKLSSRVSGRLKIDGKGFDIKENDLVVSGAFGELKYGNYILNDLKINASKDKGNAAGELEFKSLRGSLEAEFDFRDIFTVPAYDLAVDFRNVDPGKIAGIDSLDASINGRLMISGSGNSAETAAAAISFRSAGSEILGEPVNDFSITADYDKGDYNFRISDFETPFFGLSSNGHGNIYKPVNIDFGLHPHDLASLGTIFDLPRINASGQVTGTLTGTMDSLMVSGNLSLSDVLYDSITVGNIKADFDLDLPDSLYSITLDAGNINLNAMNIRSADLKAEVTGKTINADLDVTVDDSLSAEFTGIIEGFSDPLIKIGLLHLVYGDRRWSSNDSAFLRLGKEKISINRFSLSSGSQSLNIDGIFSFAGSQDLELDIENLELQLLPLKQFLPYDISGTLNSGIRISGTSRDPVITGDMSVAGLILNEYTIDSLTASAAFENEMLSLSGRLSSGDYRLIDLEADVPFHISFSDSVYLLRGNPGFSASVSADSIDIKQVSELYPVKNTTMSGTARAELSISNSMNDPEIKGSLLINNGSLENKEYGISVDKIRLRSYIDSSLLKVEEFTASSGRKGTISIQGSMALADSVKGAPEDLFLSITADDFQAIDSKMAELNFDSDLRLTAGEGKPRIEGDITINESEVNADYFGEFFSEVKDDPDPPLLIEALGDTLPSDLNDTLKVNPALPSGAFYQDLTGEAVLNIPGNTWVRGKDMNAEVYGTLRAIKSGEEISLFGDLNIRRGFYKLYGKRFDFNRGGVSFTGASDLNPNLDFEVIHKFRDINRELKELKLTAKGRLNEPELEFSLDDRVIEEKDAISYIVFGRSINELGENERSRVAGNDDVAMNAAFSGMASALRDVLQQTTGLDVVEISGEDDWSSTSVTIGKYITNKLYIAYEQSFNFDRQSKVVDTEKFMLEYHILRNLILKATNQEVNSGFDLIFTRKWK